MEFAHFAHSPRIAAGSLCSPTSEIDYRSSLVASTDKYAKQQAASRRMPKASRTPGKRGSSKTNTAKAGGVQAIDSIDRNSSHKNARATNVLQGQSRTGHRRNSSQSLTLDLEGLDLGHGVGQAGTLEVMKEESSSATKRAEPKYVSNYARQPFISHSRPSTDLTTPVTIQKEEIFGVKPVEDSFFAHLRKCEDSNDILDSTQVLSVAAPQGTEQKERDLQHTEQQQQVLGGFASLGYHNSGPSQSKLSLLDTDNDSCTPVSMPGSPRLGGRKPKSPWSTLVPVLHDPMNTLDILSIEEMGLHSIDVGNADDWEGVTLAYPCEVCSQIEASSGLRDAQWTVARSLKRQRKWIVTPQSSSPSRTVVISDHVSSRQQDQARGNPAGRQETPQTFSGQEIFELRFLQAGTGAPKCTIRLASPAMHRLLSRRSSQWTGGEFAPDGSGKLNSVGVHEERDAKLAISDLEGGSSKESDEQWPSMLSKATAKQSRAALMHSKSSSTIHASIPMVQLDSRRPSLGRSISHESLVYNGSPNRTPLPESRRGSTQSSLRRSVDLSQGKRDFRQHDTTALPSMLREESGVGNEDNHDSLEDVETSDKELLNLRDTPFGDYSMGLSSQVPRRATAATGVSSPCRASSPSKVSFEAQAGPSPRSSSQALRSSPRDKIPVLSTIDPERILEYQRASATAVRERLMQGSLGRHPWQMADNPTSLLSASKPSSRKDRRLSEWIRKKVLPGGSPASAMASPPLPPAWEQFVSPATIAAQGRSLGGGKSGKVARAPTKPLVGARISTVPFTEGNVFLTSENAPGSTPSSFISPIMPPSSPAPLKEIATVLGFEAGQTTSSTATVSLSRMPPRMDGQSAWPGVFPPHGLSERRRSNSDDNLASLGEAAKRRLEVLGQQGVSNKQRTISTRSRAEAEMTASETLDGLSRSMPPHSTLSQYGDAVRQYHLGEMQPIDLLDLDSAPSQGVTMLIPLPMSLQSDSVPVRYLRVSYVPFGLSASGAPSVRDEDSGRESMEGGNGVLANLSAYPSIHPGNGTSPAWYRKLTHAWSASATARSNSPGSNEDDQSDAAPTSVSAETRHHVACPAPSARQKRNSTVESFRIIAKVLEHPMHPSFADSAAATATATTTDDEASGVPPASTFPVILGVCDRQRSVKLIPEGWEAIGMLQGPAEGNGSLSGVADLIIAGCAACMDL